MQPHLDWALRETPPHPMPQDNEAPEPTAAMLSHVYALKDIISAIKAAAIIVHDYGVKEYKLEGEGWGWGLGGVGWTLQGLGQVWD
jgi:hypothetical protein